MTTITANIPARKVGTAVLRARVATFTRDDSGQWWHAPLGTLERLSEADVIDVCQKAGNWAELRRAHFAMHGFHG